MSRKSQHLSKISSPKTWQVLRKSTKWITKPTPGPRKKTESLPLVVLLRDILNIVNNKRELKYLINNELVLVNGINYRDTSFPIGLFDVISFPRIKKNYRVILTNKGRINATEISEKEANLLLLQIIGKRKIRKGKLQINLSNGWNILNSKKGNVSDSIVFDTKSKKIVNIFSYKSGAQVYFIRGKRAGTSATFKELKELGRLKKEKIAVLNVGKDTIESNLSNLMVVGGAKSAITIN